MAFDIIADIKPLLTGITSEVWSETVADDVNCIVVQHYGGMRPEHTFGANTKSKIIKPRIQILIRHTSEDTMHSWWDSVFNALDGKTNYTPTGTNRTYLCIMSIDEPHDLGRDKNRRHIQTANFEMWIINAR